MSEYLSVSEEKNTENIYGPEDVLSVSGDYGVVNQIEFQGRSFAGASVSNYGVVYTKNVVYTKSPLKANPYGIIKTNKGKVGIVSVLYGIYIASNEVCPELIQTYFEQDARLNNYLRPLVNKGAKNTLLISDEDALKGNVVLPPTYDEQIKIKRVFEQIDNLITLHQCKQKSKSDEGKDTAKKADAKNLANDWEQRKLGIFAEKVIEKNSNMIYKETFTNSAEYGIISQRDFFDHDISKQASLSGYYVIQENDFVYNPRISVSAPVGPINCNKLGRKGVMSPLYTVFRARDVDFVYLEYFFKTKIWHSYMRFNGDSGARSDRFSIKDELFFEMPIPMPDVKEQKVIGDTLKNIDNLITLHRCKDFSKRECCETLKIHKKHKTMATTWEQRKLGETALSYSGGTPTVGVKEYYDGRIPFIRSAEINSDFTELFISEKGLNESSAKLVSEGDILYALYGATSGEVGRARLNGAINQAILAISPLSNYDAEYITQWLRKSKNSIVETYLQGGQGNLSGAIVKNLIADFPSCQEQQKIGVFFHHIDNLITLHQRG